MEILQLEGGKLGHDPIGNVCLEPQIKTSTCSWSDSQINFSTCSYIYLQQTLSGDWGNREYFFIMEQYSNVPFSKKTSTFPWTI